MSSDETVGDAEAGLKPGIVAVEGPCIKRSGLKSGLVVVQGQMHRYSHGYT